MKKQLFFLLLFPFTNFAQTIIGEITGDANNDFCGKSTALSADGSIVAVSSPNADINYGEGNVRVYQKISNNWIQMGQSIFGENAFDESGSHISISDDGLTIAIGAIYNDGVGGNNSGHIRVFKFISNSWSQIGQDIDGSYASEGVGYKDTFNLSNDGNNLIVGYYNNALGKVKVFQYQSNSWVQVGQDLVGYAISSTGSYLGNAVDISSDGSTIIIGERSHVINSQYNLGRVKVYEFNNGTNTWLQVGQDINGTQPNNKFGTSVSISSNGLIIAIGAENYSNPNPYTGIVQVYENTNGNWIQKGQNLSGQLQNDYFGQSIQLSSSGNVLAVSSLKGSAFGTGTGVAIAYEFIGSNWVQVGQNMLGATQDNFGESVSISSNGQVISVGATGDDSNGTNSGKLRIYDISSVLTTQTFNQNAISFYPNPVKDILSIENSENESILNVEIYSTTGKLVIQETKNFNQISVEHLANGMYILKLNTSNGVINNKFIKQ